MGEDIYLCETIWVTIDLTCLCWLTTLVKKKTLNDHKTSSYYGRCRFWLTLVRSVKSCRRTRETTHFPICSFSSIMNAVRTSRKTHFNRLPQAVVIFGDAYTLITSDQKCWLNIKRTHCGFALTTRFVCAVYVCAFVWMLTHNHMLKYLCPAVSHSGWASP